MKRLNKNSVAQFLNKLAASPIKFPNVARMIASWIESGRWEDVEGPDAEFNQDTIAEVVRS